MGARAKSNLNPNRRNYISLGICPLYPEPNLKRRLHPQPRDQRGELAELQLAEKPVCGRIRVQRNGKPRRQAAAAAAAATQAKDITWKGIRET